MIEGLQEKLDSWIEGVNKKLDDNWRALGEKTAISLRTEYVYHPGPSVTVTKGRKYIKIIQAYPNSSNAKGRSVYAFIDMETGSVLKPACWSRPAKHKRGNLFDIDNGLNCAGPYGIAYLK